MLLRNSTLVGGSPGALPPPAAAAFARGAAAVLARWTALRLAVEGEWGGPDSGAKADRLLADVVAWFGRGQGKERGGGGASRSRWGGNASATPDGWVSSSPLPKVTRRGMDGKRTHSRAHAWL